MLGGEDQQNEGADRADADEIPERQQQQRHAEHDARYEPEPIRTRGYAPQDVGRSDEQNGIEQKRERQVGNARPALVEERLRSDRDRDVRPTAQSEHRRRPAEQAPLTGLDAKLSHQRAPPAERTISRDAEWLR